uniref:ResIII domain-containing protein n=1 Tax=Heterorhabditis bacteriophora TaxID=37862 RepID=A0A1I7XAC8_HETBA
MSQKYKYASNLAKVQPVTKSSEIIDTIYGNLSMSNNNQNNIDSDIVPFGTGKTVVGTVIAGSNVLLKHKLVIMTAMTNAAVSQFTETLLAIDEFRGLTVLRISIIGISPGNEGRLE